MSGSVRTEDLLESLDSGVLTLTLNRPEKLNAMDVALFDRLFYAVEAAAYNSDVRVLVLKGAGRAFSAGGDLSGTASTLGADERADQLRRRSGVTRLLHTMPKPTVAMLRGATAGAAIAIALGCDFRIASETTKLVPAFVKAGFSGDFGISYMLTRLVGPAKAREIMFFGEPLTSSEALSLGLVNKVVADDALEDEVAIWIERLISGPGFAYRMIKQNLNLAENASFEESIAAEAGNMIRSIESDDSAEAVRAFLEKRTPQFRR